MNRASGYPLNFLNLFFSMLILTLMWNPTTIVAAENNTPEKNSAQKETAKKLPVSSAESDNLQQLQQNIAAQIKNQDINWIESSGKKWLSLFHQDETGKRKGMLVIIPDPALRITQSPTLTRLAQDAPKSGWSTLLISIPDSTTKAAEPKVLSAKLLTDAINHFSKENTGNLVVVIHGNHSRLLKSGQFSKFKGVILVNSVPEKDDRFSQKMIAGKLNVLDLISETVYLQSPYLFDKRKNLLKSAKIAYRRVIFSGADMNFSYLEPTFSRIITAWLNRSTDKNKDL